MVRLLQSYGAPVGLDNPNNTALCTAVKFENPPAVEFLFLLQRDDIELDPRNSFDGLTLLEYAEKEDYREIVALLLERGAGYPTRLLEDQVLPSFVRSKL